MVAWIDGDGVCLDFHDHLLSKVGSDRRLEHATRPDLLARILEWHGAEREALALDVLRGNGFWETQPVLPGAREAVALIRERGFRLRVATRPWRPCRDWMAIRTARLVEELGFKPDEVVPIAEKELLHGDLLIDDDAGHIAAWAKANPLGCAALFDAPYNQHFEWPCRLSWRPDLTGLGRLLEKIGDPARLRP